MSRHDVTRASDLVLFAAVRAALGAERSGSAHLPLHVPLSTTTRRCLEAFAAVLLEEPNEDFQELEALRKECRRKTLAEYDREIGDRLRADPGGNVPCWVPELRALVEASRFAPEGEL